PLVYVAEAEQQGTNNYEFHRIQPRKINGEIPQQESAKEQLLREARADADGAEEPPFSRICGKQRPRHFQQPPQESVAGTAEQYDRGRNRQRECDQQTASYAPGIGRADPEGRKRYAAKASKHDNPRHKQKLLNESDTVEPKPGVRDSFRYLPLQPPVLITSDPWHDQDHVGDQDVRKRGCHSCHCRGIGCGVAVVFGNGRGKSQPEKKRDSPRPSPTGDGTHGDLNVTIRVAELEK